MASKIKVGDKFILRKGYGYWDTTLFGIGGSFHRAQEPIPFQVTRVIDPPFRGCDIEGREASGRLLACDSKHCDTVELGPNPF